MTNENDQSDEYVEVIFISPDDARRNNVNRGSILYLETKKKKGQKKGKTNVFVRIEDDTDPQKRGKIVGLGTVARFEDTAPGRGFNREERSHSTGITVKDFKRDVLDYRPAKAAYEDLQRQADEAKQNLDAIEKRLFGYIREASDV